MDCQEISNYQDYFLEKYFELTKTPVCSLVHARRRASQAVAIYRLLRDRGLTPAYSLERCLCLLEAI